MCHPGVHHTWDAKKTVVTVRPCQACQTCQTCQAVRACQAGLDTHDTRRAWLLSRTPDTSLTLALASPTFYVSGLSRLSDNCQQLSGSAVRTVKPGLNPLDWGLLQARRRRLSSCNRQCNDSVTAVTDMCFCFLGRGPKPLKSGGGGHSHREHNLTPPVLPFSAVRRCSAAFC